MTRYPLALALLVGTVLPAHADYLNPSIFQSLGTLNLSSGTYWIDTSGTPTLRDASDTILFTGITFNQGTPGGSPFFGFNPTVSVFAFNSITLGPGVGVNVKGANPLALLSHGGITMNSGSTINASGKDGVETQGGAGGPGGGRGGNGGGTGFGPGGGRSGDPFLGSRGNGAGYGGYGAVGTPPSPGVPYGDLNKALQGGSGGGGSGADFFHPDGGGGGGGGGGGIEIGANGPLVMDVSTVLASGGSGVGRSGVNTVLGGGGSGGGILVHAPTISGGGGFIANGGGPAGGNAGAGGRILVLTDAGGVPNNFGFVASPGSPFAQDGVIQFGKLFTPAPPDFVALFTTGSPAILMQTVPGALNPSLFPFGYDYLFQTTTGTLEVFLDGVLLDTLLAPATLANDFTSRSLAVDGNLFPGLSHLLTFHFDGPAGSKVLLNNVSFPGLLNRDFQTGGLDSWVASGPGTVSVVPFTRPTQDPTPGVPEPSSGLLCLVGLAVLAGWKRLGRRGPRDQGAAG